MVIKRRSVRTAPVVGAAVLTLLLSACGAGSQTAGGDVACDADAPEEPTTVDVLAYSSPSMDPFSGAMASGCSEVDDLTVEHSPVDFATQLEKAQLSLGQDEGTYDIVEVYSGTLPQYAGQGWLQPLDDFYDANAERYDLDDIDPDLLDFARYEGELYALPMAVNVHALVYRQDILDELSLAVPTTMDEVVATARAIGESGKVDHPLGLAFSADADITTAFNNSLTSLGGAWVDPGTGEPQLTSPAAVEAMQSLKDLRSVLPDDAMNADAVSISTQLQNGETAMAVLYTGSMAAIDSPDTSEYAGDFGFAPAPSVEQGGGPWATLNLDGYAVAANSSVDPELLGQVVANGTGPDAAEAAGRLAFPARTSVREDAALSEDAPYWEAGQGSIDAGAVPYPAVPYFVPLQTAVRPFIADGVSGKTSVEDALAGAQDAAEKIVAQYR